ncbi:hypothetical protein F4820DRAFT_176411 [Hypoxylon rubiginosum]|uniref:Uncharacterized protein n=1 Tax=Hypoxylon rubiginosum TaxID=110542 RepID=A0ACB9YJQ4_9PEZI|nr:hypothetical protein F4820DRAFT_176411 [Hypoxylon rubiginosum]
MDLLRGADGHQSATDQAQQHQIGPILRSIDEFVGAILEQNNVAVQQHTANSDESSLRSYQSVLLKDFKDMMTTVQRKVSKATHEVGLKLGSNTQADRSQVVTDSPLDLQDLVGVDAGSDLNRYLGRVELNGKQRYKLRDFTTGVEDFQIIVDGSPDPVLPQSPQGPLVVLLPTLRNVWVLQHAYAKLSHHKENLIKRYLADVDPGAEVSRKFLRDYYEEMSLANLPSKRKLGNLLDVKRSSYNHETHDLMLVLVFKDRDGSLQYVEPVTGNIIEGISQANDDSYLILPMVESNMKKVYDVYRSVRKATSEQRRATKDKEFAAALNAGLQKDVMERLQKQFSSIGGMEFGSTNGKVGSSGSKRRRMLDDDEGRK